MTEAFLHYVWQHQMLTDGLTSTDGQPIVVQKAGQPNHDAGPDFFNAHISVGGVEWVGNVEIHMRASDWRRHGHSADAAYNNVVLHVVYEADCDIELQNGRRPLTLELKHFLHPAIVANYDSLTAPDLCEPPYCRRRLGDVAPVKVSVFLDRLAVERLEAKSQTVHRLLEESRGGWEQVCYWLVARYLGGTANAFAFELLAKATDLRLLARWKDNPRRVEALLMGQAGLLQGYFEDDYPRQLQADYEALQSGAGLRPMDSHLWKFYRLRPSAFPTIRISQLASLVCRTGNMFPTLLAMKDVDKMEDLFMCEAADYWRSHYQFDTTAASVGPKRVGKSQAHSLIINAWAPLLFVYGEAHGSQECKDQAIDLLSQLPPEDNAVIRRWRSSGVTAANAAESQALLQLDKNYCQSRRCLQCRIGYYIINHR